jgi:FkbM family methyltransferase
VVSTIDGITYELDLTELIDHTIYFEGCYEASTTAIVKKFTKAGMVVIDIGANIGCHTLRFAKLVGANGRVTAFEPMSHAFNKLKRNVELNNFQNVNLEKVALSDQNLGDQAVNFTSSWPLRREGGPHKAPIEEVKAEIVNFMTLDEYIKGNEIKKLDLIKLDVDGYEYKVLKGAVETLKAFKPLIIMEIGTATMGRARDMTVYLIELMHGIGYRFYDERTMKQFPTTGSLMESIKKGLAINVVVSVSNL